MHVTCQLHNLGTTVFPMFCLLLAAEQDQAIVPRLSFSGHPGLSLIWIRLLLLMTSYAIF